MRWRKVTQMVHGSLWHKLQAGDHYLLQWPTTGNIVGPFTIQYGRDFWQDMIVLRPFRPAQDLRTGMVPLT